MELITQDIMADVMTTVVGCEQLHRFGEPDQRVTLSAWAADKGAFSAPPIDFHVLDMIQSGHARGRSVFEKENREYEYTMRPGALFYFQAGQAVSNQFEGDLKIQQLWLDRELFTDVAASLIKGDPAKVETLGFHDVFDPVISRAMNTIANEAVTPSAGGQLMIDMAAQQIALTIIRRNMNRPSATDAPRTLSQGELARAIAFIEDQIEENNGLDALSKSVGMNMYTFAHAFKESVGVSPHQFLIQRRINRAQELLAGTNDPIADIAYACGFSSQAHMTNIFAKHVGTSPARYRKSLRN